jgi:acyl-CoA reductase-like NAD-dependent aldehyde dehydrogenase
MTTIAGTKTYASQWIGGDWSPSDAEAGIDVIDPSNETTLAVVPAGTPTDAQRAVAAARSHTDDRTTAQPDPPAHRGSASGSSERRIGSRRREHDNAR